MKVINDLVGYSNLKIVQNSEYFNFSLDSLVLARFCVLSKNMKIIDLCTGNAPIPLILSKYTNSLIYGVEIQKEIYELAKESVKINNLEDRINILNIDAKDVFNYFPTDTFDLITCNPPYFKFDKNSNINDNYIKSIARHEIKINILDVIKLSKKLLKNNGSLVIIHDSSRFAEIIKLLYENNLQPKRVRFIHPKNNSNSNLVLIDAKKNGKIGLKVLPPLYCHNEDGSYTKEVMEMFER